MKRENKNKIKWNKGKKEKKLIKEMIKTKQKDGWYNW